jgi:hypothetical protein
MLLDIGERRLGRLLVAVDRRALPVAGDVAVANLDLHHLGNVSRVAGDHERLGELKHRDSGGGTHAPTLTVVRY